MSVLLYASEIWTLYGHRDIVPILNEAHTCILEALIMKYQKQLLYYELRTERRNNSAPKKC